jgi:hypothetical protein
MSDPNTRASARSGIEPLKSQVWADEIGSSE